MEGSKCASLQCKNEVFACLKHCLLHIGQEGFPVQICSKCNLPCIAPDTLCVHHRQPLQGSNCVLSVFEIEVLVYEECLAFQEKISVMGVGISSHVDASMWREVANRGELEEVMKRRKMNGDFGSPSLASLLETPADALALLVTDNNDDDEEKEEEEDQRSRHIDRVVKMFEFEAQRAAASLRTTQDSFFVDEEEWRAKASVPIEVKLPECKFRGCTQQALPGGSVFCLGHILLDPRQSLFKGCSVCNYPIFRQNVSGLCISHSTAAMGSSK